MSDNTAVEEIHYRRQIHFAACNPKFGNVADKDSVGLVWSEFTGKLIVSNATYSSCVGNIRPALTDFGPKTHLVHELVDEFVVDHPALVAQVQQHSPVAVAMLVGLETFQDCLLYRSMFIRLIESLLMVEECRPRHICRCEEICQAVL